MRPLVLATGFEPFEEHASNPSADVALGLAADPPAGLDVVARVLPVEYRQVGRALDEALAGLRGRCPDLVLALGVHRRAGWRLEGRARARLTGRGRPDNGGVDAADATTDRSPAPAAWRSSLDVGALALSLLELAPEPVWLSWDAGGYVCEYTYGEVLRRANEWGGHAVFVHVPPARFTPVPVQVQRLGTLAREALLQAGRLRRA